MFVDTFILGLIVKSTQGDVGWFAPAHLSRASVASEGFIYGNMKGLFCHALCCVCSGVLAKLGYPLHLIPKKLKTKKAVGDRSALHRYFLVQILPCSDIVPSAAVSVAVTDIRKESLSCITPARRIAALDILTRVLLLSLEAVDKNLPYAIVYFLNRDTFAVRSFWNKSPGVITDVKSPSGDLKIHHSCCPPALPGTKSQLKSMPSTLAPTSHSGADVVAAKSSS